VPQVYGLGDLSAILDQRLLQQTRALLDQLDSETEGLRPDRSSSESRQGPERTWRRPPTWKSAASPSDSLESGFNPLISSHGHSDVEQAVAQRAHFKAKRQL